MAEFIQAQPFNINPSMSGISEIATDMRDQRRKGAIRQELMTGIQGTPQEQMALMAKYPEMADKIKGSIGFANDLTSKAVSQGTIPVLSYLKANAAEDGSYSPESIQQAQEMLVQAGQRVAEAGGNPENLARLAEGLSTNPQAALAGINMLAYSAGPDAYEAMIDGGGAEGMPSNVQEWTYYNKLNKKDQQRFLDMKRGGNRVVDINGVPTVVPMNYVEGSGVEPRPLSTLGETKAAGAELAGAKEAAIQDVKSKWKEFNALRDTAGGRVAGLEKANYFYDLIDSGKMATGGMRKMLSYIPFTFTEQGAMDEEFNAFAETAARQALKESGETKPTDADVKGMKQAMFGIGRDERVNLRLLKNFKDSISRNDHKAFLAEQVTKYRKNNPLEKTDLPTVNVDGWKLRTDNNGIRAYVSPDGKSFKQVD